MNIEALLHIPKSNYAYAYNEKELHIRLRTAKENLKLVELYYGNKFDWANKQSIVMEKILTDEFYHYYQASLIVEDSRIGYYFKLKDKDEVKYYTEAGLLKEFNDELAYCYFFQYPFINPTEVHKIPSWIHEAVFYQIFVERFYNGNIENSPPNLCQWEDNPKWNSFFGGDLKGIIQKLEYLQELGVNCIYLTPVFQSTSNHKYDIIDYLEIDNYFGDKETFHELVDKAHKKGIKIILDAVFNHCNDQFKPFQEVIQKGRASKYYDWFFIEGNDIQKNPPNYKMFGFAPHMPKLNTGNPKLKEYLLSIVQYWTSQYSIDGWRLDVSDEIDHSFWREFREVVKNVNKEAIIIGENWHDALPWLMGDQFDSVMNYSVTKKCIDFFAKGEINAIEFEGALSTFMMRYSDQVNDAMMNLLDSHDTERFLYTCNGEVDNLKNAAAFLFGFKGMPCTYYGTEIGMTGKHDPGCRKGFDWDKRNWNTELFNFYKKLITVRKTEKVLQYGSVRFMSTEDLYVMKRTYENESIYILINNTYNEQTYNVEEYGYTLVRELLSGACWRLNMESFEVKVPSWTAFYMKFA